MPLVALAAIAGGAAVATGVVAASTMAMIGLGTSVVGKLTKSKELMQIGGGLSLGTGIASLGQSLFGATEGVASAGSAAGTSSISNVASGASAPDAASWMAGATDQANSWVNAASNVAPTTGLSQATGVLNSTPSSLAKFSTEVAPMGQAAEQASMAGDVAKTLGNTSIAAPGGTDPGAIASWWSKLPESTKNTVLQMGGNAASKLFEGWSQEEVMAFQREKFKLEQDRYNQAYANANAQPTIARPTGLLNATRG
jgi:hypothetical protein